MDLFNARSDGNNSMNVNDPDASLDPTDIVLEVPSMFG